MASSLIQDHLNPLVHHHLLAVGACFAVGQREVVAVYKERKRACAEEIKAEKRSRFWGGLNAHNRRPRRMFSSLDQHVHMACGAS